MTQHVTYAYILCITYHTEIQDGKIIIQMLFELSIYKDTCSEENNLERFTNVYEIPVLLLPMDAKP